MAEYLSLQEVAKELNCDVEKVCRLIYEDRTLKATRMNSFHEPLDEFFFEKGTAYSIGDDCYLEDDGVLTSEDDQYDLGMKYGSTGRYRVGFLRVERSDLERFIADRPQGHSTAPAPLLQVTAPSATTDNGGASIPVELPEAKLLPLTTVEIAFCFAGIRWQTEAEWKDALNKNRKWLEECLVQFGTRGRRGNPKLWNPVFLGASLVRHGYAKPNSIRARFQLKEFLMPWFEAWKTYEAENFDTP